MDDALAVKNTSSITFPLSLSTQNFCFGVVVVVVISIQKTAIFFMHHTGSTMFYPL
jgi:hypothetical protein